MRFKVLEGAHVEGGHIWHKGEVVDSRTDLLKHNRGDFSKKFEATTEPANKGRRLRGEDAEPVEASAPKPAAQPQQPKVTK